MKNKLCGIGEALIDFIPEVKGQRLKDVPSFKIVAGGAPANVVGAVTKLAHSIYIFDKTWKMIHWRLYCRSIR